MTKLMTAQEIETEAAAGQSWINDLIAWVDVKGIASPGDWTLVKSGSSRTGGTVLRCRCHSGLHVTVSQKRKRYEPTAAQVRGPWPAQLDSASFDPSTYHSEAAKATDAGWAKGKEFFASLPYAPFKAAIESMEHEQETQGGSFEAR